MSEISPLSKSYGNYYPPPDPKTQALVEQITKATRSQSAENNTMEKAKDAVLQKINRRAKAPERALVEKAIIKDPEDNSTKRKIKEITKHLSQQP